jgi:hypothetical protein
MLRRLVAGVLAFVILAGGAGGCAGGTPTGKGKKSDIPKPADDDKK